MNGAPDIELLGVKKRFKDLSAVDDVSLRIPRGAFYSLLGPSGCGKTTTLRIIAGLETPDAGEVRLRGKRVNDVPPYKRNLGMVFQGLALFPHLNVFNNVAYGLRVRHMSDSEIRKRVPQSLKLVGLSGLEPRRISQLSGGQQQRVALARALVSEPSVLLLDEPLGALDLKLRVQMQFELKRIHREVGTTFVFVTHDQGEAMAMSDRVAVMSKGRVEQEGTPEEIYHDPATPFVADFIGETNLIEGTSVQGGVVLPGDLRIDTGDLPGLAIGAPVMVSVRPESIDLGSASARHAIRWKGTVGEAIFRGTNVLLTVRLWDGLELIVHASGRSGERYALGSEVEVGFDPESVRVFPLTRD